MKNREINFGKGPADYLKTAIPANEPDLGRAGRSSSAPSLMALNRPLRCSLKRI